MELKGPLHDKVRATFLGIAIGDALGKPVETAKPQAIVEKYGRIDKYYDSSGHKWFNGDLPGTWTDDAQLTLAVARGMIRGKGIDLDAIAEEHGKEFAVSVRGWGASTREAVARIVEGVHWSEASKTDKPNRGTGNGVCMKVAPVGIYMALTNASCKEPPWNEHILKIVQLAIMTHRSSIAVTSGLAHAFATLKCVLDNPGGFDHKSFVRMIIGAAELGKNYLPETLTDDMGDRFKKLEHPYAALGILDPEEFGGGSCYVYDSLPFTYAWFLRNPQSIDSLYDCVSGGGDTDTNGSMLAGMLGSLHGTAIFPAHLLEELDRKDEIVEVADEFYETFKPVGAH